MVKHTCYDLSKLNGGEVAEVTLVGNAANVRAMTRKDYQLYLAGKPFKFFGGLAMQSPYCITIPSKAHWFLTVDMQGLSGTVISTVQVINPKNGNVVIPANVVVQ